MNRIHEWFLKNGYEIDFSLKRAILAHKDDNNSIYIKKNSNGYKLEILGGTTYLLKIDRSDCKTCYEIIKRLKNIS